jgi:peptide-methionine (R)-S-oxide reductase
MERTDPSTKNDEQWRAELTPEQYDVLRRAGTERPFTGRYVHEKTTGMYQCAGCGADLFSSDTKFDSGTGWPSFTDPAHRGGLRALRRASRARLRRRPGRQRPALLHQLLRAAARAGGIARTRDRVCG